MYIMISNLHADTTSQQLMHLFSQHGEVSSADIMVDGFTGKSRGFAYINMPQSEEGKSAVSQLHQQALNGMVLDVQETVMPNVQKGSYKVGSGPFTAFRYRKH